MMIENRSIEAKSKLEPIEYDECLQYIWSWFCDLSGGRGYSEAGPGPLTYAEIRAWAELTKQDPEAWEIQTLKRIDRIFISESLKK